jgi:hypothetical protein
MTGEGVMLNDGPHSAVLRANEIKRLGLAPNKYGDYRKPPAPSEEEVAILRRIARGSLVVTHTSDGDEYTYEDGSRVSHPGRKGFPLAKFVKNGWIVPVQGESMFETDAQRYVRP